MKQSSTYQKIILATACFIVSALSVFAQTVAVSGRISTSDGLPAGSVSVKLKGRSQGAVTDKDGFYRIERIPAGDLIIQVSAIGLKSQEKPVSLLAGETAELDFVLAENAEQLKEIIITGNNGNRFARKQSDFVAKMPLKNLENPQVYNTVGKELLTDQLVFTVDDAIRNAPGVQKLWEPTGRAGDGGSYYASRGFNTQTALRNGVMGLVTSTIDAVNLEKLEVIKGPSATLFGTTLGSYGAQINRVIKKPYDHFGGEFTSALGSDDFHRVSLDLNTPLDNANTWMFRLNGAYSYQGGFQKDNVYARNYAIAPSILYKPNDRLSVTVDAEMSFGRNTSTPIVFFYFPMAALGVDRADEVNMDYTNSYMGDDLTQKTRSVNLFGQVNYQISELFTSSTNISYGTSYSDGFSPYYFLVPDSAVTHNPADIGKSNYLVRADQSTRDAKSRMLQIQQNFNGDFHLGSLRNRIVLGLDFVRVDPAINFYGIEPFDVVPLNAPGFDYSGFNGTTLQARYDAVPDAPGYITDIKTNTYSVFASDVLNLTDNLLVLAALRVDHYDNKGGTLATAVESYSQTALSPKFGLVYQPVKDQVSLFANYQNGFTNLGYYQAFDENASNPDLPIKAELAKPEQANQWEAGVKLDLLDGKLSSTVSYYDIKVKNTLRADSRFPLQAQIQDANKVSRGIDVELIGNLFKGFNAVAGFSYNDNKFENTDEDVDGRRDPYSMSPYTANLWLSYRLPDELVKGLGFGVGGNYAGDSKVVNSVSNGVFILPAYTLLNASVFYETEKFRFGFKADNLNNKHYWIGYGTMNPQRLRNMAGSVTYKF